MKRILSVVLVLICVLLSSCDHENTSVGEEANYSEILETAQKFIDDGNYEDAYKTLYSICDYPEAKEMLADFKVLPLKAKGNGSAQTKPRSYVCEYSYDENFKPLIAARNEGSIEEFVEVTGGKITQTGAIALIREEIDKDAIIVGASGSLPGDLQSKVDPYLRPLYDALYEMSVGDEIKCFDKAHKSFESHIVSLSQVVVDCNLWLLS